MELVDQHGTADLDLVGKDGNAFNILGLVGRALREAGWPDAAVKEVRAEMMGGDYDHLLCVAMLVTEPVEDEDEDDGYDVGWNTAGE